MNAPSSRRPPAAPSPNMADEATRRVVSEIPVLRTHAGPRDRELWVQRLKEEYQALIRVSRAAAPREGAPGAPPPAVQRDARGRGERSAGWGRREQAEETRVRGHAGASVSGRKPPCAGTPPGR